MTLGAADDPAVLDHQAAAQVDLSDAALGAQTLKGRVAGLCDHVARGEDVAGLGIVDHDVRVGARGDDALAGIEPVELRGIFAQGAAHSGDGYSARGDAAGVDDLAARLHAGQTAGDPREVLAAHVLLREGERAVVGGDGLDLAAAQTAPERALIFLGADGRRADIARGHGPVGVVVHAVVEGKVLRAGLDIDPLPAGAGKGDLVERLAVGQVDDDHRRVRRLGDAQQPRDRLGLEIVGPRLGVGGNVRRASGGLELGNARVDHTRVLAVDARDAAALFQRLERGIHRAVADHHGGVGEVHLKGRDASGEHIVQLALDALVPVVDGHVEAVVARAFAVGLFVPEIKTVGKRLALVRAGEVDDGGRAAADGAAGAGREIVGGGRIAHVEIEVRVRVDEAGEEVAAGNVRHLGAFCLGGGDVADLRDLLAVEQDVRAAGAAGRDDKAAPEQFFHIHSAPLSENIYTPLP